MKEYSRLRAVMRKLMIAALAAALTASGITAGAPVLSADAAAVTLTEGAAADEFTYISNDDGTLTVTGLASVAEKLTLPSKIDGQKVAAIGRRAFEGCTALKELTIPASVVRIDTYAFFGCDTLAAIKVKSANTVYASGGGILFSKDKAELICCPKGKSGAYTVPDTVSSILPEAFSACTKLTSAVIPESVKSIGKEAFNGCTRLKSVSLPEGLSLIEDEVFRECTSLVTVNIPSTVTRLGSSSFYYCKKLPSVSIPASVKEIGDSAFDGCIALAEATLSSGVRTIGDSAFSGCCSLGTMLLPASLTSLGDDVFFDCQSLESVYVNGSNTVYSANDGILYNKSGSVLLFCPEGRTKPYRIKNGTTAIQSLAFNRCRKLKAVYVPDSVTNIAGDAFSCCDDLTLYGSSGSRAESYAAENNIRFTAGEITLMNTSEISAASIALGDSVTVSCSGEFYTGTCKYAVYYGLTGSTTMKHAQLPSTNTTVIIKPDKPGVYTVQVQLLDGSGKTVSKNFTLTVSQKLTNTSTVSAAAVNYGKTVTVNCSATGGTGAHLYAVYYRQASKTTWTCAQKYVANSTVVIQPKEAVDYVISVKVMDDAGKISKKTFGLTVRPVLGNVSRISSAAIPHGKRVKVVCVGKYGTGSYTYAVYYKQSTQTAWTCAQDYSTNDTVYITPKDAVRYDIRVKVRDSSEKVCNKDFSLNVTPVLTNTSRLSVYETDRGKSVKVLCSGREGTGELTYAVYYRQASKTLWHCAQEFSNNSSVTITPKYAASYIIRVKVRDTIGKTALRDLYLNVKPVLTNTSRLSASSISFGKSVTVSCSSKEGSGTPEYAVYYKQASQTTWTCAQDYSSNTSVTVTPKAAADYNIRVKVRDSRGKIANKDLSLTVKPVLTNTSRISASSITLGRTVRVVCSGKNGTGELSYAVYYKLTSRKAWTCAQEYGSGTSVTIEPKHIGEYTVRVKVRDEKGKVVNKDFTVTVNKRS